MRRSLLTVEVIVALLLSPLAIAQNANDACRQQIPESLALALAKAFPGLDLPRVSDNSSDDIEYNRQHGGSGCLGVATGDFDGKGKTDFALALTPRKGHRGTVVVAIPAGTKWSLRAIYSAEERRRLFVQTVPPGHYDSSGVSEDPKVHGERDALDCPRSGILTGETEATGTVFCRVAGKWQKVVVAD